MEGRGDLSDGEWERLWPFLPVSNGRCGRWRDHRQVINGILHRNRTGVPWRDLPKCYGPWKTVYERHRKWSADGTWERLFRQVQAVADHEGDIDWEVSVDSTIERAHQHAAGARQAPPPPVASSTGDQLMPNSGKKPRWRSVRPVAVEPPERGWAGPQAASPRRFTCVPRGSAARCLWSSRQVSGQTAPSLRRSWTRSVCRVPGRAGRVPGPPASPPIRRTATVRAAVSCDDARSDTPFRKKPTTAPTG